MVSPIVRCVTLLTLLAVLIAGQCSDTCAIGQDTLHQQTESSQSGCHHRAPVDKHQSKSCVHQLTAERVDGAATKLIPYRNTSLAWVALPAAPALSLPDIAPLQ